MNNLDRLKEEFFDVKNEGILKYLIPVLEDFEKRINKLEQRMDYIPNIDNVHIGEFNQVGGIDDIIIEKGDN